MSLHLFVVGLLGVSFAQGSAAPDRTEPSRQLVYKVKGLTCPAVSGLGCGHLLAPELARLDKLEGVERSFANRTGTMARVTVSAAADREKVAGKVSKFLSDNERAPTRLSGDELARALGKEEWREAKRIAELSAIEFRTLALGEARAFAEAEKLGAQATEKFVRLVEEEWDRTAGQAVGDVKPESYAKEWSARCSRFATSLAKRAKGMVSDEQHARLKERLACCFYADESPQDK